MVLFQSKLSLGDLVQKGTIKQPDGPPWRNAEIWVLSFWYSDDAPLRSGGEGWMCRCFSSGGKSLEPEAGVKRGGWGKGGGGGGGTRVASCSYDMQSRTQDVYRD